MLIKVLITVFEACCNLIHKLESSNIDNAGHDNVETSSKHGLSCPHAHCLPLRGFRNAKVGRLPTARLSLPLGLCHAFVFLGFDPVLYVNHFLPRRSWLVSGQSLELYRIIYFAKLESAVSLATPFCGTRLTRQQRERFPWSLGGNCTTIFHMLWREFKIIWE